MLGRIPSIVSNSIITFARNVYKHQAEVFLIVAPIIILADKLLNTGKREKTPISNQLKKGGMVTVNLFNEDNEKIKTIATTILNIIQKENATLVMLKIDSLEYSTELDPKKISFNRDGSLMLNGTFKSCNA